MAITSLTLTQTGQENWRLEFTSDAGSPTFYIWQGAILIGTTPLGWFDLDEFRAEPGQQASRVRTCDTVGQLDDTHPVERWHPFCFPHGATITALGRENQGHIGRTRRHPACCTT